jgi:hypothetical protein
MKKRQIPIRPAIIGLAVAFMAASGGAQPDAGVHEDTAAWSETVDGLRGRLVITDGDIMGKPKSIRTDGDKTYCIYVELQNVGPRNRKVALYTPCCFQNMEFTFELVDPAGALVPRANEFVGYTVFPAAIWLELPPDSTLRFPVTTGDFEADPQGGKLSARLELDRRWPLSSEPTQRFSIRCRFSPTEGAGFAKDLPTPAHPYEVWTGSLELPGVALPERNR